MVFTPFLDLGSVSASAWALAFGFEKGRKIESEMQGPGSEKGMIGQGQGLSGAMEREREERGRTLPQTAAILMKEGSSGVQRAWILRA